MKLDVRVNPGAGGHSDLFLSIPLLGLEVCADTYYFVVAMEEQEIKVDEGVVRQSVVALLKYWIEKVSACDEGAVIHLPFDFSDQYTGCLQVTSKGSNLLLSYGFSLTEGWRVDPLNPSLDFQSVCDFEARPSREIEVPVVEFLDAVSVTAAEIERSGQPRH